MIATGTATTAAAIVSQTRLAVRPAPAGLPDGGAACSGVDSLTGKSPACFAKLSRVLTARDESR